MNIFINLGKPRALRRALTKSDNSGNMLLNFSVLLIITAKRFRLGGMPASII